MMARHTAARSATAIMLGSLTAGALPAHADVVYDTLWLTNQMLIDAAVGNAIGGWRVFPSLGMMDSQLADDFTITSPIRVTRIVADIATYEPGDMPSDGFHVQFYRDAQGVPDEALHAEARIATFETTYLGLYADRQGFRFVLDMAPAQIALEPGTWWVDIQPIDETGGGWFWSLSTLDLDPPIGSPAHVRDGWLAHGNTYRGLWNHTDWQIHNFRGRATPARLIEGEVIGAGCRPDLTTTAVPGSPGYGVPNGVLNNDDFFYYLAQFALGNLAVCDLTATAVPGTPGYGVPNGVLNNDDFFYYLVIFAAGC